MKKRFAVEPPKELDISGSMLFSTRSSVPVRKDFSYTYSIDDDDVSTNRALIFDVPVAALRFGLQETVFSNSGRGTHV